MIYGMGLSTSSRCDVWSIVVVRVAIDSYRYITYIITYRVE